MDNKTQEQTGKFAATLTLIELGLGSLLHSLKIPFSGHILSLNQITLLARASFQLQSKKASLEISLIASLLKSLSPAGKKLTPMLAIAAQGVLFYIGLIFGGLTMVGVVLASVLASAWAFIQPVMFLIILYGKTGFAVAEYFLNELQKILPKAGEYLFYAILVLFIIKSLIAIGLSIVVIRMKEEAYTAYQKKFIVKITPRVGNDQNQSVWKMALKDLFSPLFLFSFFVTTLFFLLANSDNATMIWGLFRPLAVGYCLFFLVRAWPVTKTSAWLRRKGYHRFADNLETAFEIIKRS